jgi:hypothetical protein
MLMSNELTIHIIKCAISMELLHARLQASYYYSVSYVTRSMFTWLLFNIVYEVDDLNNYDFDWISPKFRLVRSSSENIFLAHDFKKEMWPSTT